ncbi:molecular chaperone GrpE [Constrictibacter sp. MBR-5]|jgi:molecular chaperone GrpE|uniref:nucleotide exchange factor GrpE n=1 Tax=Constrictibacter sp. MBR-5 TaxID=3156467 RepID=UPI003395EDE7
MSKEQMNPDPAEPVANTAQGDVREDGAATAERQDGQPDAPEGSRIAELEAEIAGLKDQHLRALAEIENVRRRGQRDRDEAAKYGAAGFARDMLAVADNLRRGIDSVPAEARRDDQHVANLIAGVELVEKDLLSAFEKHGVQRVDPKPGERFDANVHQAMFEVENSGQPAGTVAQVLQPGYVLNGRLLRAAMVGVAKGEAVQGQKVDTTV